MVKLANPLILPIALAHLGFLLPEMFYRDQPTGRRIFAMTPEQSASWNAVVASQGLYNG